MERDERADERMAFMAGEVGCVVFELVYNGIEINRTTLWDFWKGSAKP
jgi:hypothetical protein